jgi:CRISPR-associated endonuclease Csn1
MSGFETSNFVLGLDLGPNSIGWAMLEHAPDNPDDITGFYNTDYANHPPVGVRVFEAGLANFDSMKEKSLCQDRRTARAARRTIGRRNARRKEMRQYLRKIKLLPETKETKILFETDPYQLRSEALDRKLLPFELGRVLYHLCQRRGFKSNRKGGKENEDSKMLAAIGELAKSITETGARTLGEYLYKLNEANEKHIRIRNRHTRRDMYEFEFNAIVEKQRELNPDILTDEDVEKLHRFIFFQHSFELTDERREKAPSRANLHRAPSVKECPLEKNETCGQKGEWISHRFRILKEVNNLKISELYGKDRDLTEGERDAVISRLSESATVKFDQLRKMLAKMGVDPEATFNLERGDRKALNGNIVDAKLASAFGKAKWAKFDESVKIACRESLLHSENPADFIGLMIENGMKDEKAEKLSKWNPADGYVGYSLKAMEKLVPHLEIGLDEHYAIEEAYPDRVSADAFLNLPTLSDRGLPQELRNITNPVVSKALVEVRKVINALVREHGIPTKIVVELAREMKAGSEARKRMSKNMREQEERRTEARERVEEYGGNRYSRSDVNRWLLWSEQNGECVYTGKPIPPSELFYGAEWDVDHILPHWQSLDDSYMNKVLVSRNANHDKGDRTPTQWLGKGSQKQREMIKRAYFMLKHGFPMPKIDKLKQEEVEADGFAQRQLNDTRYISKSVAQYLNLLYPQELRVGQKAVQTCTGGLTSELRRQWGLNGITDDMLDKDGNVVMAAETNLRGEPVKSRANHKHHAVDAVVVALSTRKILKKYQDYCKIRYEDQRPDFPVPWDGLREDAALYINTMFVSHRVMKKLSGALHKETFYGAVKDENGEVVPDRYVTRKNLDALSGKDVDNIRDNEIKSLIQEKLYDKGWTGQTKLPKDWSQDGLFRKNGTPIRKVRVEVTMSNTATLGDKQHRHAALGNNNHVEIFKDVDGKLLASVVPTMIAASRVRHDKASAVKKDHDPGTEFVMSLSRKESVMITNPTTKERVLCVVQKLSGAFEASSSMYIVLRDSQDSRKASDADKSPLARIRSASAWSGWDVLKQQVDPLGRIFPAND